MTKCVPDRLYVTRESIAAFDKRMGLPGLGKRYVAAGVFVIVDEEPKNMDTTIARVPA